MHRLFIITGFIVGCAWSSQAQKSPACTDFNDVDIHNEFAFSILSVRELPTSVYRYSKNHNRTFSRGFHSSIVNGLMYKLHWKSSALRLGGSYLTALDDSEQSEGNIVQMHKGLYHGVDLRLGYQRTIKSYKKQWFLIGALDVYHLSGTMRGHIFDMEVTDNTHYTYERHYTERSRENGLALSVGLYYKVKRNFSISWELTGNYSYVKTSDELDLNTQQWVFRYHPMRMFSLNYHF